MAISIEPVSGKQIKQYIDFQHELYADDPMYVPELYMAQKDLFNKKKNPFFEYADVQSFLAKKDGKIVGRASAILNTRYNEYHNSNVGFFGFMDFVDDREVSRALLDTCADWCRKKGVAAMLGPTNFSTNDTAGVLTMGYDDPPKIMLTYNKPYYQDHYEALGCVKEMDLQAYILYTDKASDKSIRLANVLEERLAKQGITIRNFNMKNFKQEVAAVREIYNNAWSDNWGFVPWTDAELDNLASELKMIVNPDWVYMAEHDGKPIGFALTMPNINEITKDFKKGRLFPFNIFKLLTRKHKTRYVRIMALGVNDAYRKKGIEAIFFAKNILQARKDNIIAGEVSWVLENNTEMVAAAKRLNSELYKNYRIYRYNL